MRDDEFVISADEKISIQARHRLHPTLPPRPGIPMKVEHEYEPKRAWAYLAALDVYRLKPFGRCQRQSGIDPFDRLVAQVMTRKPYGSADASSGSWAMVLLIAETAASGGCKIASGQLFVGAGGEGD